MNNTKIVFFDIDGTLLPHKPDSLLPQSTIDALNKAKENGVLLYICTGRPYAVLPMERLNGVEFDGFICFNGGIAIEKEEILYENLIDTADADIIIENAKKNHVGLAADSRDEMYVIQTSKDLIHYINTGHPDLLDKNVKPLQFCAGLCYKDAALLLEGCKKTGFTYWCDYGLDIIPNETSKANALKNVCELHSIDIKDSMAIGDGVNDISMIEAAGIGVAMGNSQKEVFKHASYITSDIEQDGIKNAFLHFGIIR